FILLLYSIAGVRLDSPAHIQPLGIPLVIERANIFEWALLGVSVYAAFRYWYYAILAAVSPFRVRKLILTHKYGPIKDLSQARKIVANYFPLYPLEGDTITPKGEAGFVIRIEGTAFNWTAHWRTKFWIL